MTTSGERPTVALYTCAAFPNLYEDDLKLAAAFAELGLASRPQRWDEPQQGPVALGLLRSTWDYYLRPAEFLAFLAEQQRLGVPLLNPVPLVRWNLDKRYLFDLSALGIPTVQSEYLPQLSPAALPALWDKFGELVIKPTISAGSFRTLRLPVGAKLPADPPERTRGALADSLSPEPNGYLVQPFLPQIFDGEWSLVFFAGRFSHAVRKRPKAGDFRVQEHYGGQTEAVQPSPSLLAQAEAALHAVTQLPQTASQAPPCYARVDGVCVGDRFLLIELELIEPALYFSYTQGGEARLAQAVLSHLV